MTRRLESAHSKSDRNMVFLGKYTRNFFSCSSRYARRKGLGYVSKNITIFELRLTLGLRASIVASMQTVIIAHEREMLGSLGT